MDSRLRGGPQNGLASGWRRVLASGGNFVIAAFHSSLRRRLLPKQPPKQRN